MNLSTILRPIHTVAKTATGDTLRRSHYTQQMGGGAWKTLTGHMVEAQGGTCALCGGDDLKRSRIDDPRSVTLHLLIPSAAWGTEAARNSTTANNGKSLDPYRFGFVPGNVVVAHTGCSQMCASETASMGRLAIDPSQIITTYTAEMRKPAKVVAPMRRDEMRRTLQARGWMAEG